ncbi:MAG TPA: PepSY domain-containing protein [Hyphomicrobium sp.]|nr:PepSY domain-containing protein [Hyphomicrobium sp.]
MTRTLLAVLAAALCSTAALADAKPSEDEAKKVKAALTEWGCEGGTIEKESEATGVFEVDDAKCKGAQYDIKLDSAFKLISLSRD